MSNYLIDQMIWSHSRLTSYLSCPYQFYQKYINPVEETPMFLAQYGSFIHEILSRYYAGELSQSDALEMYLTEFHGRVFGRPPSDTIFNNYFHQGIDCMKRLSPIDGSILEIENRSMFEIDGYPFVGIVDLVYQDNDGSLCIIDHKSRDPKQRSNRRKPTKMDIELEFYTRQLYLYSIPIMEKYGKYPDFLEFNCYRTGNRIKQAFHADELEATKHWAVDVIHQIEIEKEWKPDISWWRCHNLCGFCRCCEYAQMAGDRY